MVNWGVPGTADHWSSDGSSQALTQGHHYLPYSSVSIRHRVTHSTLWRQKACTQTQWEFPASLLINASRKTTRVAVQFCFDLNFAVKRLFRHFTRQWSHTVQTPVMDWFHYWHTHSHKLTNSLQTDEAMQYINEPCYLENSNNPYALPRNPVSN